MAHRMHVHTPVGARILHVFQLGFAKIFAINRHWTAKKLACRVKVADSLRFLDHDFPKSSWNNPIWIIAEIQMLLLFVP
jgi:hypothetical protein